MRHSILVLALIAVSEAFVPLKRQCRKPLFNSKSETVEGTKQKSNKAMKFLKKIGRVGGAANKDFRYAIGIDEGPSSKFQGGHKGLKKGKHAFQSCAVTGIVDDMSETFPTTTTGTQWSGFTDRVMGGCSMGTLSREIYAGKMANVLRGNVSLENNGGFIQMATNLCLNQEDYLDASAYDGIELDVKCEAEGKTEFFNVHLKTNACPKPFSSYRATFEAPVEKWKSIRIPWSAFKGHGPGACDTSFDTANLKRAGIVAIGRKMNVELAVAAFRFYSAA